MALNDVTVNPAVRSFGGYQMVYDGTNWQRKRFSALWAPFAAQAIGSAFVIISAAGANKKIRVMELWITLTAAVSFKLLKADGTTLLWQGPILESNKPYQIAIGTNGVVHTTANEDMKILSSASANMTGSIGYCVDNSTVD